jgi:hypothetical protein
MPPDVVGVVELLERGWNGQPDHGPHALRALLAYAIELGMLLSLAELTDREADWSLHGRPNLAADRRAF